MSFYKSSRATLNETFMAKYNGVFFQNTPKWDQNPIFTPLSETMSAHFVCDPPRGLDMKQSTALCRGGSRGKVQGVCTPLWDELQLSNTTGIQQKSVVYWC